MTWLAILFFCLSEQDCRFAYYEAVTPMECEKKLADMQLVAVAQKIPVQAGTCIMVKGRKV